MPWKPKAVLWIAGAVAAGVLVALVTAPPREEPSWSGAGAAPSRVESGGREQGRGRESKRGPQAARGASETQGLDGLAPGTVALTRLERALAAGAPGRLPELVPLLGRLRVEGAAPLLVRAYRELAGEELRLDILQALQSIGGPKGVRALAELARTDPALAAQARLRLARIDDRAAAPALVAILEEEGRRGELAVSAVRALGRTRLREQVPLLTALARDSGEEDLVSAAAEALGRIADPSGVEALGELLRAPSARTRRAALRALGSIRAPRSIEILEAFRAGAPAELERRLAENALSGLRGEPRLGPR